MNSQKTTLNTLAEWERIAFDHEQDFLEKFCHKAWQLLSVYWASDSMKVVYLIDEGQHITDSSPINDWLEFYNSKIESETSKALKRAFE